jgi:hypothetical protein
MDEQTVRRHKGLGIASFVLSLAVFFVLFIGIGGGAVLQVSGHASQALFVVVGLFMVLAGILALIGIGLGVAGLFDPESKKTFPILGIIISAGMALFTVAIVIVGLNSG